MKEPATADTWESVKKKIRVRKKDIADILKSIAEAIRIKVTMKKHLKEMTNLRRSIRKYFDR